MGIQVYPVQPQIFSSNTTVAVKTSTPLIVQDDTRQFDDEGYLFVNPNVPGADIATGDKQSQQLTYLQALATAQSPPTVFPNTIGIFQAVGDIIGPITLNGATRIVTLISGTYGALTYTNEVSEDGKLWTGARSVRQAALFIDPGTTVAVVANATQANIVDTGGWTYCRARCTAFVSGACNVSISPSTGASAVVVDAIVSGTAGEAAPATGLPVRIAGWDGVNIRTLLTDAAGQQVVNQGTPGASAWPVSIAAPISISGVVPVSGSLSLTPATTPTVTQEDAAQYDDDGIPFVNPNVPGADIATGSAQEFQRLLLAQIAAATPPQLPPVPIFTQFTTAGQIIGPIPLNGQNAAQVALSGTYASATPVYEVSQDQIVWFGKRSVRNTGITDAATGLALSANSTIASSIDVSGWLYFRVRCQAFGGSGILNMAISTYGAPTAPNISALASGPAAEAAAASGFPVRVSGTDSGGLTRTLATDAAGQQIVNQGVPGTAAWPVSMATPPPGVALETAGQLQRIADLLEAVLVELRVHTAQQSQMGQAQIDDGDVLRGDELLSIN